MSDEKDSNQNQNELEIEVGDFVQLRNTGLKMVCVAIGLSRRVKCEWFANGYTHVRWFSLESLKLVPKSDFQWHKQKTLLDLKEEFEAARQTLVEGTKTAHRVNEIGLQKYFTAKLRLEIAEEKLLVGKL